MSHEDKPRREIDYTLHAIENDPGAAGKAFRRFMMSTAGSSEFSLFDDSFLHLPGDGTAGFLLIRHPSIAPVLPKKED
jgi:hypothetical protein